MGPDGVKACLRAGANDLGGTLMDETITRSAGAVHGQEMTPSTMEAIIRSIGRVPRQRTTLYGTAPEERYRRVVCAAHGCRPAVARDAAAATALPKSARCSMSFADSNRRSSTRSAARVGRRAPAPDRRRAADVARSSPILIRIAPRSPRAPRDPASSPTRRIRRTCGASTGSTMPIAGDARAVPGHVVLPPELTGVAGADRRAARPALSDDRRAQGAGGLRVPGAAAGHRPIRSRRTIARSGRRPATTVAAAWRSRASSGAAAWPCCRPA